MTERPRPSDEEKREQSAAGILAILVVVGGGLLVAAFWRGGFAGAKAFVVWAWGHAVLRPLSLLADSDFWFDSLWGYALIIWLTIIGMRVCGLLTIVSGKGLNRYFRAKAEGYLKNKLPPALNEGEKVRIQRLAGIGAFFGTVFCLGIVALLLSIPLVWLYSMLGDPFRDYRIAVVLGGEIPKRYAVVATCIFLALLVSFPRE